MKFHTLRFLLLAMPLVGSLACTTAERCAIPFDQAPPPDFELRMSTSGGMLPQWESCVWRNDSLIITRFFEGAQSMLGVKIDAAATARVWGALRDNDFGSIKTRQEETYDRGGITLDVSAAGNACQVSDAGLQFIEKQDIGRWRSIVRLLSDERDSAINRYGVRVSVVVMDLEERRVSFRLGWTPLLLDSMLVSQPTLLETHTLPGQHVVSLVVDGYAWDRRTETITEPALFDIRDERNEVVLRRR